MPRGREMSQMTQRSQSQRSQRATQQDNSDDDCETSTQSTLKGSQAISGLSEDQFERLVSSTVYYMLVADQKKAPIKKSDINKLVLKEYSRAFNRIIVRVREEMKHAFGIEVVELEDKKPTVQYILVNALEVNPEAPHIDYRSAADNRNLGLLTVVLALIYMGGNRITESALWQALKKMGFNPDTPHRTFGDVRKLVTKEFVRQFYLEYTLVPESDPVTYDFTWGSRAKIEMSKMDLLNVVCQAYGNVKAEQWVTQFEDATQQEI